MLLSVYVSYYLSRAWAKTYVLDYILGMTALILVTSLSSTFMPINFLFYFNYPLASLSFPFSSIVSGWMDMHMDVVYTYNIQFLSQRILSVSNENIHLYVFSFYLLVNFLGVILGYWFEKTLAEEPFKAELFEFFSFSGFCSFGICFFTSLIVVPFIVSFIGNGLPYGLAWYIFFFCIYFFWIPALIMTAIHTIRK